jgi:SAM-dependent methyltransferase
MALWIMGLGCAGWRKPRISKATPKTPMAQPGSMLQGAVMSTIFGAGFHVAPERAVDTSAYDGWIGRWSRLFVPAVLAAAEVAPGCRVLDVSTGTGEAALMTLPIVDASGVVIGADISPAVLEGARGRLDDPSFLPVAADGQALPFGNESFDAVICQLGLQFFPDPALGLREFRRALRIGGCAGVCASPPVTGHRCGACLPMRSPAFCRSSEISSISPPGRPEAAGRFARRRGLPGHPRRAGETRRRCGEF